MRLKTRYIILFIFCAIFLISATILLKYAAGYQYNFKKNIWQKTGILVLESIPKNADIFLNGKLQKQKTPTKIMNLFPGDYLVKLQKLNSFEWQKNLIISPNLTTFAQNIILFKKNQSPALLLNKNIGYFKLFSDNKRMLYLTLNKAFFEFWIFDFETKKEKFLNSIPLTQLTKINNFSFDATEKKFLIEGNNNLREINYLILNVEKPKEIIFLNEFALGFQNIKWHQKNDKILYGITKIKNQSILAQINLKDKKIISIISETTDILDYYFDKEFIYYLTLTLNLENKNVFLKRMNKNNSNASVKIGQEIARLPFAFYSFKFSPVNTLTILDEKNQLLYLISIQPEIQKIILEAKDALWSKDQKKLLYYNDLELWICYLNQEKLKESYHELLGRWSQKISKAIWHSQENYSIFASLDSIKAIEIDNRNQKNITQLLKSEKIEDIFFSSKNKILYFIKEKKLYEMEIY